MIATSKSNIEYNTVNNNNTNSIENKEIYGGIYDNNDVTLRNTQNCTERKE